MRFLYHFDIKTAAHAERHVISVVERTFVSSMCRTHDVDVDLNMLCVKLVCLSAESLYNDCTGNYA